MRSIAGRTSMRIWRLAATLATLAMAAETLLPSSTAAAGPPRRARPPKFDKSIQDAFFPDARATLSGSRPNTGKPEPAPAPTTPEKPAAVAGSGQGWSKWIAAEALEDEIKAQQQNLAAAVANAGKFKGGEFQEARTELSVLAVAFAIIAEFDGSVRWQRQAAALRDRAARAGLNCKVGTDATFKEVKTLSDDLQLLVRGGSLDLGAATDAQSWTSIAERAPLMKRIEQAQQQSIAPGTANAKEFERTADRLGHEAQLVAALAEVITREGYEYADDESYLEHARAMQAQAAALRDAASQKSYEQARQAAAALGKACVSCHEGFRS
jgi:hypothetical protein